MPAKIYVQDMNWPPDSVRVQGLLFGITIGLIVAALVATRLDLGFAPALLIFILVSAIMGITFFIRVRQIRTQYEHLSAEAMWSSLKSRPSFLLAVVYVGTTVGSVVLRREAPFAAIVLWAVSTVALLVVLMRLKRKIK
jgi:hypothetical protein